LRDPVPESVAQHSRADVHQPLLGDLREVRLVGEVGCDIALRGGELEHLLDGQILVLWDVQRLHLAVLDVCLLAAHQVLQEVDRGVVCIETGCQTGCFGQAGCHGLSLALWPVDLP